MYGFGEEGLRVSKGMRDFERKEVFMGEWVDIVKGLMGRDE